MINITKLYCGEATSGDSIRYGQGHPASTSTVKDRTPKTAAERRPVTVWNVTRTCNLRCIHCYTDSELQSYSGELTTEEGLALIDDLTDFGIPALLLSGGEPLLRPDLFALAEYASHEKGLRLTLSTNGTLITPETAARLKAVGFTYIGISLDGIGEVNDRFRGRKGAFEEAMAGFRHCTEIGQRVGLRLTLTQHNVHNLEAIFDFIDREGIDRACFYHLCYAGRGHKLSSKDLPHAETRRAMDTILARTRDFHERDATRDILTVDNHVDGVYLYMKLLEQGSARAPEVLDLLTWNGGGLYSSGVGIADVDPQGNVHPDQFWMHHSLGNVRERKFSEIWMDTSDPLLRGLKNRREHVKGRCAAGVCKWFDACGGAMRARADAYYGDPFAPDPACYLTDDEIGLTEERKEELQTKGEWFARPASL